MIESAGWLEAIRGLVGDAAPLQWAAQAATAAACIALAWLLTRSVCSRFTASPHWKFGQGEFRRVVFPFMAVVLVGLAELVADRLHHPVRFLEIARALLVALLAIRLALYILGHVLPAGAPLRLAVRIFASLTWIVVALHITGLLPEVRSALDDIGFTMGKEQTRITLLLVIHALAAMIVTLTVAMWLARVTAGRILAAQTVEMSTRVVAVKILNTIAVVIAVLVALPMAGIDITALSFFGGALGVGLGFGLQKVAASYVSGFIVLLERSLRIGDVITVDNRRGVVEAIESRYTVIKAGDGTETILPNEALITKEVIHHTYTDPKVATVIPVTVAYGTDADRACDLLAEVGGRNARVIGDPSPLARVSALNERGIQLELTVWIRDPEKGDTELRSELLKDILRTFAAEGVEFARATSEMRLIATPEIAEIASKTKA
jgi:small-conductance mechanosensitive channel